VTIGSSRITQSLHTLWIANSTGRRTLYSQFIVCPNPDCKKFTLTVSLYKSSSQSHGQSEKLEDKLQEWRLVPASSAKVYSASIVPSAILDDYQEACAICELSPKASATLARRCLQGILRDFWAVKPGRLVDEIREVQPKIDPLTWDAIEAVRKLGNIGAHMEKDINVIVDVDPDEANLLIGLVETLIEEWYIARAERTARMGALISAAASKP